MQHAIEFIQLLALSLLIALVVVAIPYAVLLLLTAPVRMEMTRRSVVSQIAATVSQHIPLASGLALAARSESHRSRRRLVAISRLLDHGMTLSESMRAAFPECPGMVVSLVQAGERAGCVADSVEQADQYLRDRSRMVRFDVTSMLPYALLILSLTTLVALMLLYVITPKFVEILSDFTVDNSKWVLSGFLSPALLANVLITLSTLLFIAVIVAASLHLRSRKTPRPGVLSRTADWLRWRTPGLRRMESGQGMAVVCNAIRFCVRSGMNLHDAVETASELDINWRLRQRFSAMAADLACGTDPRQAARSAGLGEIAGMALAAGRRHGGLSSALQFAADYYAGIVSRWWIVFSNLTWPLCTLMLASIVGLLVYAMFQPLLLLIDAVMVSTGY